MTAITTDDVEDIDYLLDTLKSLRARYPRANARISRVTIELLILKNEADTSVAAALCKPEATRLEPGEMP